MTDTAVAVVGMACRLPDASNVYEYWRNLKEGRDCVRREYDSDGHLVRAGGWVDDLEGFDNALFPLSARDASLLDPQHRMLLETSCGALESAGAMASVSALRVGFFAGTGFPTYLLNNVLPAASKRRDRTLLDSSHELQMLLSADKDYATARVAYLLDLRGPVVAVQGACATGLVATHLAVQSLLLGECDLALAGAASATVPQLSRINPEPGMVISPDGFTRSFDRAGSGTVFSSGAGVVALKLLSKARADGDEVLAVIRGSAIGNDGAGRVGLSAPSTKGQAYVIEEALAIAGVPRDGIDYVEGHGTATPIGDPIEVQALTSVLQPSEDGPVWLGSVKSQIGHTGTASGIAGLIKTILMLRHGLLVASANFETPNPNAPFDAGVVQMLDRNRPWERRAPSVPRRAGVSAFGLGGTNAHVVVEESLSEASSLACKQGSDKHFIFLSATTDDSLAATVDLFAKEAPADAAAVAFSIAAGRPQRKRRLAIAAGDSDLHDALRGGLRRLAFGASYRQTKPAVLAFSFTGHLPGDLAIGTPFSDPVATIVAEADKVMLASTGFLASDVLGGRVREYDPLLVGQPAQFVFQAALVAQFAYWGIRPDVVVGHSLGELAAAYAAGAIGLHAGIRIAATRGRLLAELPSSGAMVSVTMSSADAAALAAEVGVPVDVAAVNGAASCVLSGSDAAIGAFVSAAQMAGVSVKMLDYGRAGHSRAVDSIMDAYAESVRCESPSVPRLPLISNLTGDEASQELRDPSYWGQQLRSTVEFHKCLKTLERRSPTAVIEIGPGPVLSAMAEGNWSQPSTTTFIAVNNRNVNALASSKEAAATLWELGFDVAIERISSSGRRLFLPPTVPGRARHWIDEPEAARLESSPSPTAGQIEWVYKELPAQPGIRGHWLVTGLNQESVEAVCASMREAGHLATGLASTDTLDNVPDMYAGFLAGAIRDSRIPISGVVALDSLDLYDMYAHHTGWKSADSVGGVVPRAITWLTQRTMSLVALLARDEKSPRKLVLVTRGAAHAQSPWAAVQAIPSAVARCAARELPELTLVRLDLPVGRRENEAKSISSVVSVAYIEQEPDQCFVAEQRLVRRFRRVALPERVPLSAKGVYIVSGGASGVGLEVTRHLIGSGIARVVVCGRSSPESMQLSLEPHLSEEELRRVRTLSVDLTDAAATRRLIDQCGQQDLPLLGVVHCAAEIDDAFVVNQTQRHIEKALGAKAIGAWNLHVAVEDCARLEVFTVMSSATGILGNSGQANYAGACAFVDSLVAARVDMGLPGQSIAWGPWAGTGQLSRDDRLRSVLHQSGMGLIPRNVASELLGDLLGSSSVGIYANDWPVWASHLSSHERSLFEGSGLLIDARSVSRGSDGAFVKTGIRVQAWTEGGDRQIDRRSLSDIVNSAVETVVGVTPDPSTDLRDVGLDSLSALQLRNAIARDSGLELRLVDVVGASSVDAIVARLWESLSEVRQDRQ